MLAEHGYEPNGTIGEEGSLIDVKVWRHQDGHLLVDYRISGRSIEFFILADDVGA